MGPAPEDSTGGDAEPASLRGVRVAVLGCGAVGGALAAELTHAGAIPVLWSRSPNRAQELWSRLEGAEVASEARLALAGAALGLLAVADDALAGFAAELASAPIPVGEGAAVLHTNGALGPDVLAPLAGLGLGTGKVHPLVAVPPASPDPAAAASLAHGAPPGRFRGAWFATAGDARGRAWATRLVRELGGRELVLGDDAGASLRLHAAAALLSGGFVALYGLALEAAGGAPEAAAALTGLLASTVSNVAQRGPSAALTGPIARGSLEVVRAHLATLEGDARDAYLLLGRRMLALASQRGALSAEELAALRSLLA